MPANFYNSSGSMTGLDLHDYWGSAEVIVPVHGSALHAVHAGFDGSCSDEASRLANVTSSGKPTLQAGFERTDVVHVPVLPLMSPATALPHVVLEPYLLGLIHGSSTSAAVLKKGSVTGAGKPLAICVHGAFGTNLNCGDPVDLFSDVVHNENSVMTEPSAADLVAAWGEGVVKAFVGAAIGKGMGGLVGDLLPEPLRKDIEDALEDEINERLMRPMENKVREVIGSLGVTHV